MRNVVSAQVCVLGNNIECKQIAEVFIDVLCNSAQCSVFFALSFNIIKLKLLCFKEIIEKLVEFACRKKIKSSRLVYLCSECGFESLVSRSLKFVVRLEFEKFCAVAADYAFYNGSRNKLLSKCCAVIKV